MRLSLILVGLLFIPALLVLASSAQAEPTRWEVPKSGSCYADSSLGGFPASNACDGIETTRWISGSTAYPHWMVVNFTSLQPISEVSIHWDGSATDPTRDFVIQSWNSAEFITNGRFQGYDTVDSGATRFYNWTFGIIWTDRIRIYGFSGLSTNVNMRTFEIHAYRYTSTPPTDCIILPNVYGCPPADFGAHALAINECSSDSQFNPDFGPALACDGLVNPNPDLLFGANRFISAPSEAEHWIQVNLSRTSEVDSISIMWMDGSELLSDLRIDIWNGVSWETRATPLAPGSGLEQSISNYPLDRPVPTSMVRFYATPHPPSDTSAPAPSPGPTNGLQIVEIKVKGISQSSSTPSVLSFLTLFFLGSIWIAGALAGTILRTGFFVILGGISALAFAITAWTTTGELFSSTLLFAAAVLTLAWVPFMTDRERTPE